MRFDLAAMSRRARNSRKRVVTLREIAPTASLAADLYSVYRPVVAAWAAATPTIAAAYARTIAEATARDGTRDSVSEMQSAIEAASNEISRLLIVLTPELRQWALRVERFHRGKWVANVLSASGVSIDTLIGAADVAEPIAAVIARNVALVRHVSAQTERRIADSVFRGFSARRPARDVAREMSEAVGRGRARALRIASDQATKLTAELDGERMRQAGIDAWKWRSSHKQNFRPEHQARDGKRYTFSDPPAEMPGEAINCGCRKQALLELE